MNAISRPKRPVASASAKPRKAQVVTCAEGLRASELMSEPNTLPMPMPAPTSAMQARPAPIIFAAATSMVFSSGCKVCRVAAAQPLVKMKRVGKVKAGQDGEDIRLQHCHEQLQPNE